MNSTPQGIAIGHVALDFENSFELIAFSNPPNEDVYSLIESLLIAKSYIYISLTWQLMPYFCCKTMKYRLSDNNTGMAAEEAQYPRKNITLQEQEQAMHCHALRYNAATSLPWTAMHCPATAGPAGPYSCTCITVLCPYPGPCPCPCIYPAGP